MKQATENGRRIIHVVQGETAVINSMATPKTDLMTTGLSGCCVIIIADNAANISFTHFDDISYLKVIEREVKRMQGDFTIDVVAHTEHLDDMAKRVQQYLNKHYPSVVNSKGNKDIRKNRTGTVLVRHENDRLRLLCPERIYLAMLSPMNAKNRERVGLPADNPFKHDTLEDGAINAQVRMYERSIQQYCSDATFMPTVVFDNQWTGQFPEVSPENRELIAAARDQQKNTEFATILNRKGLSANQVTWLQQGRGMYLMNLALQKQVEAPIAEKSPARLFAPPHPRTKAKPSKQKKARGENHIIWLNRISGRQFERVENKDNIDARFQCDSKEDAVVLDTTLHSYGLETSVDGNVVTYSNITAKSSVLRLAFESKKAVELK